MNSARPSPAVTRGKPKKSSGSGPAPGTDAAPEPVDMTPLVSEVIGTGADAHRIVRVGPWVLDARGADAEEVRVRDVEIATRLGYAEPRMVRRLIKAIWPENQRPHVRSAVERTSMPRGGVRETTVSEYWLTEAQALKVIARSETKVADAILDEMIAVYIAARRGLLRPTQPTAAADPALGRVLDMLGALVVQMKAGQDATNAAVAAVAGRLSAVESELSSGVVGIEKGDLILRKLRDAGRLAGRGDKKVAARFRAQWDKIARNGAQFVGKRTSWYLLPRVKFAIVESYLDAAEHQARRLHDEAAAAAEKVAKAGQVELPFKPN